MARVRARLERIDYGVLDGTAVRAGLTMTPGLFADLRIMENAVLLLQSATRGTTN